MKLSTTVNVLAGDTFERIARRAYGAEFRAGLIRRANPGVEEPLIPGTVIIVPALESDPAFPSEVENADTVSVFIEGSRFDLWYQMRLSEKIDRVATLSVSVPFDNALRIFKPFAFQSISVFVGDQLFFSGTLVTVSPRLSADENTLTLEAYSKPGVLGDCTVPASSFPDLEFKNQTLDEIAQRLAEPFGVPVRFEANAGAPFTEIAIRPDQKIFDFLANAGAQKNIIFSNSPEGELLARVAPGETEAIDRFIFGEDPISNLSPSFSAQSYYSHVTALVPSDTGSDGTQFTVPNPHLSGVVRPFTFHAADNADASAQVAASAKLGLMFGNMVRYSFDVPTWRARGGELWRPGQTVGLLAPGAMIFEMYNFLVSEVTFFHSESSQQARLSLTLPGAYRGEIPERLPWGE